MVLNTRGILVFQVLAVFLCSTQFSCKKDLPPEPPAQTLKANAGPDQTVRVGQYAILDGSGSTRGDGDTLIYEWAANGSNPTWTYIYRGGGVEMPGFYVSGTYRYTLVVKNRAGTSEPDEVVVTVLPRGPSAFSDSCLELSVRYELQIPTGEITNTNLLSMDSLRASVGRISSISGIERCSNLRYVLFSLQNIQDIGLLAHLQSLELLRLDQNRRIVDLTPLSALTTLRYLDVASNQISNISPLSSLTNLIYLHIEYNDSIRDISPVGNLTNLQELWVSFSRLNNIAAVSRLTQLRTLWIAACGIADIEAVRFLTQIRLLNLQFNNISDISSLRGLVELQRAYLEDNQIVDISSLVDNTGVNAGDVLFLGGNPLDSISVNVHIPALRNRGVVVMWP